MLWQPCKNQYAKRRPLCGARQWVATSSRPWSAWLGGQAARAPAQAPFLTICFRWREKNKRKKKKEELPRGPGSASPTPSAFCSIGENRTHPCYAMTNWDSFQDCDAHSDSFCWLPKHKSARCSAITYLTSCYFVWQITYSGTLTFHAGF